MLLPVRGCLEHSPDQSASVILGLVAGAGGAGAEEIKQKVRLGSS